MKGILVIIDGLGDLPNKLLGNKTPLEAAETPNLDFLCARGELGIMYPVKPGFVPESDESLLSIFGNDLVFGSRGYLEALGAGLELARGDLAMRANFATIDSLRKGNILDRRTGRTLSSDEAETLAHAINKIKMSSEFVFKPTIQHKAVLVFRGGFSEDVVGNDATYVQGKTNEVTKIKSCKALDDEDNSNYTANVLNEFVDKAHQILLEHEINKTRKARGLLSANYILLRSPGIEAPKLKKFNKWMAVTYSPLEKGFSKESAMEVFSFDYPRLKDLDSYSNLWEGLKTACKFAEKTIKKNHKNFDYCYVHFNETDFPGHDNKPIEKKMMLEYLDKTFFKFLKDFAPPKRINVVVTSNNSTPCKFKNHTADPVPVLFYNGAIPREKKFNEREARIGTLGRIMGVDLLKKVGFV